jgi:CheY-like chemotaxis protein
VASGGPKALAIAQEEPPDVILLDLGVPGMDGYEVAHRLRELPALKDVLLVALTGYGREADRCRSLPAGFDGHLVKPAEADALKQLLAQGNSGCVIGLRRGLRGPSITQEWPLGRPEAYASRPGQLGEGTRPQTGVCLPA